MDIEEILKKVKWTSVKAKDLCQDDEIPFSGKDHGLKIWSLSIENGMVRADMEDGTHAMFPVDGSLLVVNRIGGPLGLSLEEMGHWAVSLDVPMGHSTWSRDAGHNAVRVHDFVSLEASYLLFDEVVRRWPVEKHEERVSLTKDHDGWWVTLWGRGETQPNGVVKTRFFGETVAEACLKAIAAAAEASKET